MWSSYDKNHMNSYETAGKCWKQILKNSTIHLTGLFGIMLINLLLNFWISNENCQGLRQDGSVHKGNCCQGWVERRKPSPGSCPLISTHTCRHTIMDKCNEIHIYAKIKKPSISSSHIGWHSCWSLQLQGWHSCLLLQLQGN